MWGLIAKIFFLCRPKQDRRPSIWSNKMPEKQRRIYVHITSKYANFIGAHAANFSFDILSHKMKISIRKKKKAKEIQKKKSR